MEILLSEESYNMQAYWLEQAPQMRRFTQSHKIFLTIDDNFNIVSWRKEEYKPLKRVQ